MPQGAVGDVPMAVYIPGFGRGRIDGREIANDYATRLGAGVLSVLLGLRFGYATLLSWFGAKLSPGVRKVCDDFQAVLIRNEHGLGYAGLATGLFSLLLNVFT